MSSSARPISSKKSDSALKDNDIMIYQSTPSSTKNYTVGSYLSGLTKNAEYSTPSSGSLHQ
jgi:hypothetical protein